MKYIYPPATTAWLLFVSGALCSLPIATLAFGPSVYPNDASFTVNLPKSSLPQLKGKDKVNASSYGGHHKNAAAAVAAPSKNSAVAATAVRSKWGVDKDCPVEYWFDERIHTLGNHGFWGAVHAAVAPLSTKIIDVAAYHGVDMRQKLAKELSTIVGKQKARVVDLCCGVGFSTRALQTAFPDAESVIGIDTSPEMVAMAEFITEHMATIQPGLTAKKLAENFTQRAGGFNVRRKAFFQNTKFALGNAENTHLPKRSYDLVTVMWAFHETPTKGRAKILKEARRLLSPGGTLAVVDISTEYVPSPTMLKGEPYVQEYQKNIHGQLRNFAGFERIQYRDIVPKHLGMWTLKRSALA